MSKAKAKQPLISGDAEYIRQTVKAATEYLARKSRRSHPAGACDSGGRWYPAESERRWCCSMIRDPSRSWPWSLMVHCRTAEHVAELFDVNDTDLKRVARMLNSGVSQSDACKSIIEQQEEGVAVG